MKTEMINTFNSSMIGGNLVQIDNKNRYHVTDKNGHKKILTKDQFEKNIKDNQDKIENKEDFQFKKTMTPTQKMILLLAGLGIAAGIAFNYKKIVKLFQNSNIKESLNPGREQPFNKPPEEELEVLGNPQKTAEIVGEKAKIITEKATTAVLNVFDGVSKFFKGFKTK